MLKLTLRSLLDRKIRLLLTTFAVVLGVSFVSGAFILADSLRATFGQVADDISAPLNVQVRGVEAFEGEDSSRGRVPASIVDELAELPGVASAAGFVQGFPSATVNDELVNPSQAPFLAFNYVVDDPTSSFTILEGRAPGPGEVLLDLDSVDRTDAVLGDTVSVRALAEPEDFELVGIVRFGSENSAAGAAFALFDTSDALRLFGFEDEFQVVNIASESGVDEEQLAADINAVLPPELEAISSQVVADEFSDSFGQIIDIFQNALLAFAVVALIVSAFIINNTFSIVLGQRIRELGLLRALGATGSQVRGSVMLEAGIIGVIAWVVGVGVGIGVAEGINALIAAAGDGGLPEGPLVVSLRTWIVALIVGVGITIAAALSPARKAATVAPIAALRDDFTLSSGGIRRRSIIGGVVGVLGIVLVVLGITNDDGARSQLVPLGGGAVLIFLSVALLSPLIARPVARGIGAPLTVIGGTAGRLAQENASRNPRRTAATASALMVGLALVGTVLIVGTSFKKTFSSLLDNSLQADFFITLETDGLIGFSPQLADDLDALPEIDIATGFRGGAQGAQVPSMRVADDLKDVTSADEAALGTLVDLDLIEGSYAGLADGGLLVHSDPATDLDLAPGDTLDAEFPVGGVRELTVVGIFDDAALLGNWVIETSTFEEGFDSTVQLDAFAAATVADGVDEEVARAAAEAITADYPEVVIENRAEFQSSLEGEIDQALVTVNALLGFAVVIATLGIINTLILSVFERTREIGLLRAVGMTRRQTRRMIRWEAVIVAVFGGLLGVVLGLVFGFIAVAAMPDSFITETGVPYGQLILSVVFCGFVGVIAAIIPARRAARLNVLDAIAHY